MIDNEMMIALIEEVENQLGLIGVTDFEVSRNQQPSNQYAGADKDDPIKTRIFLYAITNPNHGKSRLYSGTDIDFKRADTHHKAKTVQVSVLHYYDYSDPSAMTPEDMANTVQQLLDSPDAIRNLRAKNVFMQEVSDVRPVFTINDKDRNESTPNFDLTVNYASSITKGSAVVALAGTDVVGV